MSKVDDIETLISEISIYTEQAVKDLEKKLAFVTSSFSFSSAVSVAAESAKQAVEDEMDAVVQNLLGD